MKIDSHPNVGMHDLNERPDQFPLGHFPVNDEISKFRRSLQRARARARGRPVCKILAAINWLGRDHVTFKDEDTLVCAFCETVRPPLSLPLFQIRLRSISFSAVSKKKFFRAGKPDDRLKSGVDDSMQYFVNLIIENSAAGISRFRVPLVFSRYSLRRYHREREKRKRDDANTRPWIDDYWLQLDQWRINHD